MNKEKEIIEILKDFEEYLRKYIPSFSPNASKGFARKKLAYIRKKIEDLDDNIL
ncbi:MAG: hypothetical protein ACFFD2_15795 [Promethearchaeota archaeon]